MKRIPYISILKFNLLWIYYIDCAGIFPAEILREDTTKGMFGRNHCLVVGRAVLLAPIGLVLGGCNHLGVALHLDTGSQVSRAASEAVQAECRWRDKLEQSHPLVSIR